MSLVDGDEAHAHVAELDLENLGGETLRGHVKQLHVAEDAILKRADYLAAFHARVYGHRPNPLGP